MSLVIARPDLSREVYPGAPDVTQAWEAWKVIESRKEPAVLYSAVGQDIHPIARSHMTREDAVMLATVVVR